MKTNIINECAVYMNSEHIIINTIDREKNEEINEKKKQQKQM